MGDWELKFEEEVMASLNLEYVEEDTMEETLLTASKDVYGNITEVIHRKKSRMRGNKGCVAKVLILVQRDIIKQFNHASSSTHGNTITSVNPVIRHDTTTEPNLAVTEDEEATGLLNLQSTTIATMTQVSPINHMLEQLATLQKKTVLTTEEQQHSRQLMQAIMKQAHQQMPENQHMTQQSAIPLQHNP
jgi:uncharacterized protein YnzC (UPF0291/DUF896 family)